MRKVVVVVGGGGGGGWNLHIHEGGRKQLMIEIWQHYVVNVVLSVGFQYSRWYGSNCWCHYQCVFSLSMV